MVKNIIKKEIIKDEKVIDATGQVLGRLASRAAYDLMGKSTSAYRPYELKPQSIRIIHASGIRVTGQKKKQKIYTRYTGYPSGLKKRSFTEQSKRDSRVIIRDAIWGMLPKNRSRKQFMKYLTIEK